MSPQAKRAEKAIKHANRDVHISHRLKAMAKKASVKAQRRLDRAIINS
jgi:hypothetical protein